jgi:hypothetical protein
MESDTTYEPVFPQVIRLKDRDINLLKEVTQRVKLDPVRHQSLLEKASQKTKDLLQADTDLADLDFLETVIRDYNHITSIDNDRAR